MNDTAHTSFVQRSFARPVTLLAAILATGAAAAAGWFILESQRGATARLEQPARPANPSVAPTPARVEQPVAAEPASSKPASTPAPDPRFVRVLPPKIPAVTSPEGRRMVKEMQDAYRCMHSGSKRTLPGFLPQTAGDDAPSLDTLAASLHQSLATMPDACYVAAALPQVANPRTPSALMNVLYEDVLKRPDSIKLRTLFLVAGIEGHPMATDALENLRVAMHADFQQDWPRWEQAVAQVVAHDARGMRAASCRAR